MKSFLWNCRI